MADSACSYSKSGSRLDVNKRSGTWPHHASSEPGLLSFQQRFYYVSGRYRNSRNVDLIMKLHPYRRKRRPPSGIVSIIFATLILCSMWALQNWLPADWKEWILFAPCGVNFLRISCSSRPPVISDYNYLKSGKLYHVAMQKHLSVLGRLNIPKYSNIRSWRVGGWFGLSGCLCHAYPQQEQVISFEIEGTNSAGDLGAAASVAYSHRNLFKGSETHH